MSLKEKYKKNPYKILFYIVVFCCIIMSGVIIYSKGFKEKTIITVTKEYNEDGSLKYRDSSVKVISPTTFE